MTLRATCTATITFGLVSIPVKVYTSAASNEVSFNMISPNGNRVKQRLVDAVSGEDVQRGECDKGYEFAKDKYVVFSKEEIKSLDSADISKTMTIAEFVAADSVDLPSVEKTYFLGPDKGGDRGYSLLSATLTKLGQVAVAQWTTRGKERLVVIRPHKGGLILQEMFYAEEVRDISEVLPGEVKVSPLEEELAIKLVTSLGTGSFDSSKYHDGYATRVRNAVDQKVSGQAVSFAPSPVPASAIDLFAALKASLEAKK